MRCIFLPVLNLIQWKTIVTVNQKIIDYLIENKELLFKFLEELVLIPSYSKDKRGVDRVGRRIAQVFKEIGFTCTFTDNKDLGNNLMVKSPFRTAEPKNQTLVTGHMDTVFPPQSSFNWYKEDNTRCFGPGVADMKGGLVVAIFAVKALSHAGLMHSIPLTMIFNSDEEIGSPSSRELISQEATRSRLAYVLESGGLSNEIVTGRKGNLHLQMTTTGKAGHAAFAGKHKASAILELAHKIVCIEAMNDPECGISANAGTICGGIGANTIPDKAVAHLDFRFLKPEQSDLIQTRISQLKNLIFVPGTTTSVEVVSGRPAMPQSRQNMDLFKKIQKLSEQLGTPVVDELRQGVSDANIIAQTGTPVIDGLGPVGAKDHSEDEYIEKESLWKRCILFAHILSSI